MEHTVQRHTLALLLILVLFNLTCYRAVHAEEEFSPGAEIKRSIAVFSDAFDQLSKHDDRLDPEDASLAFVIRLSTLRALLASVYEALPDSDRRMSDLITKDLIDRYHSKDSRPPSKDDKSEKRPHNDL